MRDFDLGSDYRNEASVSFGRDGDTYSSSFHRGEGRVVITRLVDAEMQGTFWFKGVDDDSNVVNIEKGRFSVLFN
jgi:hypothetical protein